MVNSDLTLTLEQLWGTVERKLEKRGDIIYQYGAERFGIQELKGVKRPVQERKQLWKKASGVEKEGIYALQADIKIHLASLRRAENLRKTQKEERTNKNTVL